MQCHCTRKRDSPPPGWVLADSLDGTWSESQHPLPLTRATSGFGFVHFVVILFGNPQPYVAVLGGWMDRGMYASLEG